MDERTMENLLRDADRTVSDAPRAAVGLASRVRALRQRRRKRRATIGSSAASLAAIAVVVVLALRSTQPGDPVVSTSGSTARHGRSATGSSSSADRWADDEAAANVATIEHIDTLLAERDRLAAEADSQARVAQQMLVLIRRDRAIEQRRRAPPMLDPQIKVREEIERAAFQLIVRADQLRERGGQEPSAVQLYQEVVQLFPGAQAAVIARDRLNKEISNDGAML